jgi:ABC-type antimicrobial peptide transport system permease subunit
MAQQLFPGEDPVGQVIGDETLSPSSLHQVIGVVDDVREGQLDAPIFPAAYFSFWQKPSNSFFVVVRTAEDPETALPGIVATLQGLHLGIGVRNEFAMAEHLRHGAAYYLHSSSAWLAGSFAACSLILSVIGLYGVISYSVSQRTCEIGIRMALGAQRSTIRHLILGEASVLVVLGLVFGVAASFLAGRFLQSLLFQVGTFDFSVLGVASIVIAAATLIAAWIPAHRAASTDPMESLRSE